MPLPIDKEKQLKQLRIDMYSKAFNRMIQEEHVNVVFNNATSIVYKPVESIFAKLLQTANTISVTEEEHRIKQ